MIACVSGELNGSSATAVAMQVEQRWLEAACKTCEIGNRSLQYLGASCSDSAPLLPTPLLMEQLELSLVWCDALEQSGREEEALKLCTSVSHSTKQSGIWAELQRNGSFLLDPTAKRALHMLSSLVEGWVSSAVSPARRLRRVRWHT